MPPILSVADLHVAFDTASGTVYAVNGIDLTLEAGKHIGIAGESGSGKSVTCKAMLRLLPPNGRVTQGGVVLHDPDRDLFALEQEALQEVRGGQIGYAYQDAKSSLDPYLTVGTQLERVAIRHGTDPSEAKQVALDYLERVGIQNPKQRYNAYPHEFSGGMCQRVGIAMALIGRPRILVADEPTSDVDVTTQELLVDLLRELCEKENLALILVSHDLGVVAQLCSTVLVLYGGIVVEEGPVESILSDPVHPYTQGLLASVPSFEGPARVPTGIEGSATENKAPLTGCPFYGRCELRKASCLNGVPPLTPVATDHVARCPVAMEARRG
jgi:oligopeptide/dipeptide ABC transporter ATP-binding protein